MGKIVLLMVFLSGFAGNAAPARISVQVGISGVYAPGGFDASTDAYVVVNGVFQNGCYKWDRADVTKISEFNREVRSYASVSQGMCIMVLIPYQKEVRLGQLATGKHNIKFLNGDGTYIEKNLVVE